MIGRKAGGKICICSDAYLETVFLIVLLGLAGWSFYGRSYSGTLAEMVAIFWVAFSSDITLDSVLAWKDKK
jgi:hypothetical protein